MRHAHSSYTITTARESCTDACAELPPLGQPLTDDMVCCVDFPQPFMDTGSAMMMPGNLGSQGKVAAIAAALTEPSSVETLLAVSALVVVAAHLYWLLERGTEQIPKDYEEGRALHLALLRRCAGSHRSVVQSPSRSGGRW